MKLLRNKTIFHRLAAFGLLGMAVVARAHDPYQAFTDVTLGSTQMELKFSIGRFTAARLLLDNPQQTNGQPVLDEVSLIRYAPKLKQVGEKLFELTAGGSNLAPRAVEVELNDEGDAVNFTIIYPRPPAGLLRLAAVYIKRLPHDGYGTGLGGFDEAGHLLASADNLNLEKPFLDFKIPPMSNTPTQSK